jgi:hypothetical protein
VHSPGRQGAAEILSGARFGDIDAQARIAELEAEVATQRATVAEPREMIEPLRAENGELRNGEGSRSTPTQHIAIELRRQ